MFSRVRRAAGSGAILGLLVAATSFTAGPLSAGPLFDTLEYPSFSAPVGLPGVTLVAGEYSFEVAHVDSGDVVRVRYRRTNRVSFTGFTQRLDRPRGLPMSKSVLLGEASPGEAAPILAWFPIDQRTGYQFVYSNRTR